jgi:LPS-assembly lipoprotein
MKKLILIMLTLCLTSCGFQPRGSLPLAPPLHNLYLETPDPYGQLTKNLRQFLKMSGVSLANSSAEATSVLTILNENTSDQLVGINGSQQTRQYNLVLTVIFQLSNNNNRVILSPQTVSETRALTITNDQILASSNEAANLYNQMRRAIVYDIMSRLSSQDVTSIVTQTPTDPIENKKQTPHHKHKHTTPPMSPTS